MDRFDSPQDTLQRYFDDLLNDTARVPAPALRRVVGETSAGSADYLEPFSEHKTRVAQLLRTRPLPLKPNTVVEAQAEITKKAQAEVVKTAQAQAKVEKAEAVEIEAETKVEIEAATKPERKRALEKSVVAITPVAKNRIEKKVVETIRVEKNNLAEPAPAPARHTGAVVSEEPAAETLADTAPIEGLSWLENGRPPWAQQKFDVLLFKVSGLTLAVPLVSLGQIQPLTEELTPIFGQADWFMGLLPTPMGKVRTVNTAKFVMPERYDEQFLQTARYVISIDGLPWGLAVDSVNQPITLDPVDVKWRTERSKRPWLAGTVKEYMCALLDIPMMGKLLQDADVKRRG